MKLPAPLGSSIAAAWALARSGDLRRGAQAAHQVLDSHGPVVAPGERVELHLVAASCAMRQGEHTDALRELDAADHAAASQREEGVLALRVAVWRAELAYFQGRYSAANEVIDFLAERLEQGGDLAYAAFALRVRIAILLARADYQGIAAVADRALRLAEDSGDDYVLVQILNILGATHFDRATSRLSEPHARSHLPVLDPCEIAPMEGDAREALRFFERARAVAERAQLEFAAWYVAGNIERLEILLGRADRAVRAIAKRLKVLQARGATYDEIVTRSNLAWGLRTLGRLQEALHELDVALDLARETGIFNVLLEFLHYDRSVVLDALGDRAGARASYRRYLRMAGQARQVPAAAVAGPTPACRRLLEPYFLKRADRFIREHLSDVFTMERLAEHCGVSGRTLQKAFGSYRGLTPVAHVRNMRLDHARHALDEGDASIGEIAVRSGFISPTTFSLEYRKRFGIAPSRTRRATRR